MFSSLRLKLIVAFAALIFLSLFLAGTGSLLVLRSYQTQLAVNRYSELAGPVALQVRVLEWAGASPTQITDFLKEQSLSADVRVLLVGKDGRVIEDTQGTLKNKQIEMPTDAPTAKPVSGRRATYWQSRAAPESGELVFIAPSTRTTSPAADRFVNHSPNYTVVLAVPEQSISAAWFELAPALGFSGAISLVVSVIVALLLARSISRPIHAMTRASEEMARGNYAQEIMVTGKDEIGRLARSFNTMAHQVRSSHRTLRDFLANISHELKTPLTSIRGFSQAMTDETLSTKKDFQEAGAIVNAEANRMQELVDELLYLSRIESGQVPMERQLLDLVDLAQRSMGRFAKRFQEKGVRTKLVVSPLPPVVGDGRRLEQVVENLLANAVYFTPAQGTVAVRVGANHSYGFRGPSGKDVPLEGVFIAVHNTGSYIPPEHLPRIFERFYQVNKTRDGNEHGSGLGLAIAKEIVQAHGGIITVKSDPTSGTEFLVALPVS